jgi:hypothetical protein
MISKFKNFDEAPLGRKHGAYKRCSTTPRRSGIVLGPRFLFGSTRPSRRLPGRLASVSESERSLRSLSIGPVSYRIAIAVRASGNRDSSRRKN